MGFIKELDPTTTVEARHLTLAQLLRDTIVQRTTYPVQGWSKKAWAEEFAKLEKSTSRQEIADVLTWFGENINGKYTPRVRSAKAFRKRFGDLRDARDRDRERNPQVTITEEAASLAKDCRAPGWPAGAASQLPLVVQMSMNNYAAHRIRHRALVVDLGKSSKPADQRLLRFCETLDSQFGRMRSFVERWFTVTVHRRVAGWRDWNGDLVPYVFKPTHKLFDELGRRLATEYAGTSGASLWSSYLERVNGD